MAGKEAGQAQRREAGLKAKTAEGSREAGQVPKEAGLKAAILWRVFSSSTFTRARSCKVKVCRGLGASGKMWRGATTLPCNVPARERVVLQRRQGGRRQRQQNAMDLQQSASRKYNADSPEDRAIHP